MWFFLPLEPPACLPLEPEKKRKGKDKGNKKKKINWAEEKFSRDLCHGFFVFWHLQLAPDCQLTLRNRCCPSVCSTKREIKACDRVCALLSRVCALAKSILMCLWLRPFELPCNEGMNTCLQTVAVNCVSLYCICKHRFLRLLCLIPKMRRRVGTRDQIVTLSYLAAYGIPDWAKDSETLLEQLKHRYSLF